VEEYLRSISRYANHLGLFGEQFDPDYREITGNFPQAYSHIGYAVTVLNYLSARSPRRLPKPKGTLAKIGQLVTPRLLNSRQSGNEPRSGRTPVDEVKRTMSVLHGLFYDGHHQRVDYAAIKHSEYYKRFQQAVAGLVDFHPETLRTDSERIALWVNLFNVVVIHGVVELGIARSVKEVPLIFSRIQYRIGNRLYTPDDVAHGILRGNARPPYWPWRQFSRRDPR
jgi:hypothetical protein